MTEVITTPFDNEISILYKWARYFKIPTKLIIVSSSIEGDKKIVTYSNGIERINELVQSNNTLPDIYKQLENNLESEDIIMTYALIKSLKGISEQNIIDEINQLYKYLHSDDEIKDKTEFNLLLKDWRDNLAIELQNNLDDLENVEIIHDELSRYPEVLVSPLSIDSVTIKASPTLKSGQAIQPEDGMDLFNEIIPTENVPYIRYNSRNGGKRDDLFKLYKGKTGERAPNYKIIIPSSSQTNKDNNIYMIVWSGKGRQDKATKESYIKGDYDLVNNFLTIKTPIEEGITKQTILSKIENTIPVDITNVIETSIGGEFYLYDLDVNDIYLVDMILNTELMSTYLFVKETNTPYAEKKQWKIYYKSFSGFVEEEEKISEGYIVNPSSVSISLTQHYAQGGEIIVAQTLNGPTKYRMNPDMPYVKAKITQAESKDVAEQFIKIFARLMQFYKSEKAETEAMFVSFIPELSQKFGEVKPIQLTVKSSIKKKGPRGTRIEQLKELAPDLFVKGYAKRCQRPLQPITVSSTEKNAWANKEFLYKEVMKKRQIMSFPPTNPQWNFVCPDDIAPFPGVKINKDLSNKDLYPCIPCCFKDDQMDPKVNSNYNKCFRGKSKEEQKTVKGSHIVKTDKILSPGGYYGYLPKAISDLIGKYSSDSKKILRMGVPHTVNSILHCISIAVKDPNYSSLETYEQKEDYVSRIRSVISSNTFPSLLKQEMYDFNNDEIINALAAGFLDPNLLYRAIEESYNVNIYVFSPSEKESLGTLEMPRFKLFHSRSPRPNRIAVLIFRTWGTESDALEHPQCELIVDRNEDTGVNIYSFGTSMNGLLHGAMTSINKTITWNVNEKTTQVVARANIYSRINYFEMLGKLPTHQLIDPYGKTRAFILPIGNETITVIIPSTQPENLPIGEITRANVDIVLATFGDPIAITKDKNNMVDGIWYQILDLSYGVYVPIIPITSVHDTYQWLNEKELGPSNPLLEKGPQVVERIRKIKNDLESISQIIIWLYLLSKMDVASFINRYVSVGTGGMGGIGRTEIRTGVTGMEISDSSKIYDFTNLGRKFPVVQNVDEGIAQLKILVPTLFRYQDRLYIYSRKFFDGLLYQLRKYDEELKPTNPRIPSVIHRSNISEEDFTHYQHVAIFTNEGDMRIWINSLDKLSFKNIIIEDQLSIGNSLRTEPYLYSSPTGNIYMIQNVIGGNHLRAINVAYNWYLNKTNIGYGAEEFDTDIQGNIPLNVVYGISTALSPVLIENNAGESTEYLQLLTYGPDQYTAMLQLL